MYKKAYRGGTEISAIFYNNRSVVGTSDKDIQKLFENDEKGFWFSADDSDLTANGQSVVQINSKLSRQRSPNIAVNGDLSDDITNWYTISTTSLSIVDSKLRATLTSVSNPRAALRLNDLVIGKRYRVSINYNFYETETNYIRVQTGPDLSLNNPAYSSRVIRGVGTIAFTFVATQSTLYVGGVNVAQILGTYFDLWDLVVQEDTLTYAIQNTASKRPLLTEQGLVFDNIDDELTIKLTSSLDNCTIIVTTPNGTEIVTNQQVPENFSINKNFHQMLLIDRALSYQELSKVVRYFEKKARVTSLMTDDEIFATAMFTDWESGLWFDSSDLSLIKTSAAGSIPSALNNNVGRFFSKARPISFGNEVLSNHTFGNGLGSWAIGDGFGTPNNNASLYSINGNAIEVIGTNGIKLVQSSTKEFKKGFTYLLEANISSSNVQQSLHFAVSNDLTTARVSEAFSQNDRHASLYFTSTATEQLYLGVRSNTQGTYTVSDVSLKEVAAYSAQQITSTKRPLVRSSGVVFDGVDDELQVILKSNLSNCTVIITTPNGTKILTEQEIPQTFLITENFHQMMVVNRSLSYKELLTAVRYLEKKARVSSPMKEDEIFASSIFKQSDVGFWFDALDMSHAYTDSQSKVNAANLSRVTTLYDKSRNMKEVYSPLPDLENFETLTGWVNSGSYWTTTNGYLEHGLGGSLYGLNTPILPLKAKKLIGKVHVLAGSLSYDALGYPKSDVRETVYDNSLISGLNSGFEDFSILLQSYINRITFKRSPGTTAHIRIKDLQLIEVHTKELYQEVVANRPLMLAGEGILMDTPTTYSKVKLENALSGCTLITTTKSGTKVLTNQEVPVYLTVNKSFNQMMLIDRELTPMELLDVITYFEKKAKTIKTNSEDYYIRSLFADGTEGLYYNAALQSHSRVLVDHSGNDNHAYQETASKRASYNALNSLKSFAFDGVDDGYATNKEVAIYSTHNITVIAAVKIASSNTTSVIVEHGVQGANGTLPDSFTFFTNVSGSGVSFRASVGTALTRPALQRKPDNTAMVVTSISNTATRKVVMRDFGGSVVQGDLSADKQTATPPREIYFGYRGSNTGYLHGNLYALFMIDRVLTDSERQRIEQHFAKLAGLALT